MYPTSAIALFCDDIREEKSGQLTLVGVMTDNIRVAAPHEPPSKDRQTYVRFIPKIGIYIRVNFDVRAELGPVIITMTMPDGTVIHQAPVEEETIARARETREKGNPIGGLIQHVQMGGLPLKQLGRMVIEVAVGEQTYVAGTLNFVEE